MISALRKVWAECLAFTPVAILRDKLVEAQIAAFNSSTAGEISSTSGNGHSVSFDKSVGFTSAQLAAAWDYLVELFDRAATELELDGTEAANQAAIETQMEAYLRPVKSYTNDFRYLMK